MAFSRDGLCRIGGSGDSRAAWVYASTDAPATVTTSGYLNDASKELSISDVVFVVDTDGIDVTVTFVKHNSGGVVDLASGTALGDS
jgi:hypothetical protein